jgi:hypothetical protein
MNGLPLRVAAILCLVGQLAGCAARPRPDAHVPPFARAPYEPFSRADAIAIALREWRAFGSPVNDEPPESRPPPAGEETAERQPGMWQRVGEYWWLGQDAGRRESAWTGKHGDGGVPFPAAGDADYAWSAAFVSYVMRTAGARDGFPYSPAHATYINAARFPAPELRIRAERPESYAPRPGDLICMGRLSAKDLTYDDLPAGEFAGHCDLVVGSEPGSLVVVGGNVDNAVTVKHIPIGDDGRLVGADGRVLDQRYPWFVVVRVLYDD